MKIQVFHSKSGGPGVFMKRLINYLVDHFDVQIVNMKPDIYFSAVWRGNPPPGAKTIHRVDNCYFDKSAHCRHGANQAIKKAIKLSDGVVYQSRFARKICKGVLGVDARRYEIIYNAIDQRLCNSVAAYQHNYDKIFVSCALWRPIKRPRSIYKAFLKSNIPNSALIFIGKGLDSKILKSRNRNIICVGKVSQEETYQYYKASFAMIHIARLDACPNTVVESLSFGKPVICNNAGGAPELVGKDGIISVLDPPDNYKEFVMKNPDNINTDILAKSIEECSKKDWNIHRPDLNMSYCAKKYYDFFEKVLSL